ncbi:MAG: hypothetical protein B7O98_02675 [Zestosphaera tikiterensis]|uniref:Uncharacterized protein n=1 Tax=Zestosphaera tikiterensis TaxID=1973259 RepID=A0A2R7Y7Q2_9CREN|nr:MAG: hypothetical protein B7O98_02675 [Zestosphaera tikiterensis]
MDSVCPKCGRSGSKVVREIGSRRYVYYRHYNPETKGVSYCYVGPLDGYVRVEALHDLELTNIEDQDYIETAINSLLKAVRKLGNKSNLEYDAALEEVLTKLFAHLSSHREAVERAFKRAFQA